MTLKDVLKLLLKFGLGVFGSFLLLAIRDIPPLPGLAGLFGGSISHSWIGVIFLLSGGVVTLIFQVGDENVIRSFIFGLTWPPLIAALTPAPTTIPHQTAFLIEPILKSIAILQLMS